MEAIALAHTQKSNAQPSTDALLIAMCDEAIRIHNDWLRTSRAADKPRRRPSKSERDACNSLRRYLALRTLIAHTAAQTIGGALAKARMAADNFALDRDLSEVVAEELCEGDVNEYGLLLATVHDLLNVHNRLPMEAAK